MYRWGHGSIKISLWSALEVFSINVCPGEADAQRSIANYYSGNGLCRICICIIDSQQVQWCWRAGQWDTLHQTQRQPLHPFWGMYGWSETLTKYGSFCSLTFFEKSRGPLSPFQKLFTTQENKPGLSFQMFPGNSKLYTNSVCSWQKTFLQSYIPIVLRRLWFGTGIELSI